MTDNGESSGGALMPTATTTPLSPAERVIALGDVGRMNPEQRLLYYTRMCESLGLNPMTRPFEYLVLGGKTVLYARKDATEQLRKRDRVGLSIVGREETVGVYVVTARAVTPDGRCDESIGAVAVEGLTGEARANAIMKAETKAKRRVTLSICGLGFLDETEVLPGPQQYATDAPPAEDPSPNPQPPAPPVEPGTITETEAAELTALARANKRTVAEVNVLLKAVGAPVLTRLSPAKLPWMRLALAEGLAPTVQVDRLTATVKARGWPWEEFRAKLEARFGVSSLGHLTASQAAELEGLLKPAPQPQPAGAA